MAAIRISPGIYEVNGKRVQAKTAAEAEKLAGGGKPAQNSGAKKNQQAKTQPILTGKEVYSNPQGALEAERKVANFEADQGIKYGNVNQEGPAGSRIYTRGPNGEIIQTDKLSEDQQGIFDQDEELSKTGRQMALHRLGGTFTGDFNPDLPQSWVPDNTGQARQQYFDQAYKMAIGNTERNYGQEKADMAEYLMNKGIPSSEIANRPEMQQLEDRYQGVRDSASNQARLASGDEYSRDFGIQEQLRANRFSQAQGTRNQNLSEVNNFANFGQGFQNPNFQGFQGVGYDLNSPTDIHFMNKDYQLKKKQLDAAIAQAGRSGGGGSTTQQQSPFVTG